MCNSFLMYRVIYFLCYSIFKLCTIWRTILYLNIIFYNNGLVRLKITYYHSKARHIPWSRSNQFITLKKYFCFFLNLKYIIVSGVVYCNIIFCSFREHWLILIVSNRLDYYQYKCYFFLNCVNSTRDTNLLFSFCLFSKNLSPIWFQMQYFFMGYIFFMFTLS